MKQFILRIIVLCAVGFVVGGLFVYFTMDKGAIQTGNNSSDIRTSTTASSLNGEFDLTDETGRRVSHQTWDQRVKLVFFGFTHCPDICPAALGKIAVVLDNLGPEGEIIAPLFITVDPARDDAARMAEYTDMFSSRIIGLTGSQDQIDAAIDNFKVFAAKDGPAETEMVETSSSSDEMQHSNHEHMPDMEMNSDNHNTDSMRDHMYLMQHSGYIYLMGPDNGLLDVFPSDMPVGEMTDTVRQNLQKL